MDNKGHDQLAHMRCLLRPSLLANRIKGYYRIYKCNSKQVNFLWAFESINNDSNNNYYNNNNDYYKNKLKKKNQENIIALIDIFIKIFQLKINKLWIMNCTSLLFLLNNSLRSMGTPQCAFSKGNNSSKIFPFSKGIALKGKNLLQWGQKNSSL